MKREYFIPKCYVPFQQIMKEYLTLFDPSTVEIKIDVSAAEKYKLFSYS